MKNKIRLFIGSLVAIGFFALICLLIFMPMPVSNSDTVKILVGFLGGSFTMMVSFYFGDSEGK